ncbi:hypothetical protein PIB30_019151 [Stylosanthes scabra]|uniref:RNase H type-1 domain-containing protein n=1 Tax=Stylosanthes scabra TaxID=79078 RepID=A0ABU6X9Z2_9FABA|nr:hypothetical protein [Stylosanthes scabra]
MLFFAILWSLWISRNQRVFENKSISLESCWEIIRALIKHWAVPRVKRGDERKLQEMERVDGEWWWWVCVIYIPESNEFVKGGYLEDHMGELRCMVGDIMGERSLGEAKVGCLEWILQLSLEEFGLKEENVVFIMDNKNIVEWMYGKTETSWELRILRN